MPTAPDDTDPRLGTIFARRYRIVALLGEGGMGNVYQAEQLGLHRPVALKILHEELCGDPEVQARFEREMRASCRVEHPNTVRVYDHGRTEDGALYLAMEAVGGRSLAELIAEEGPLPVDRAVRIATQIARALGAAHAEGILHRDLKPDNVMVLDRYEEKDAVKVLDFGLALFVNAADRVTATDARVGTPLYMPPEYVATFTQDHRGDLYALGMVLYLMVAGRQPFIGNPYQILHKAVNEPVPPPSELRGEPLPPALEALVMQLVEKDPELRPASAEATVDALVALSSSSQDDPRWLVAVAVGVGACIGAAAGFLAVTVLAG